MPPLLDGDLWVGTTGTACGEPDGCVLAIRLMCGVLMPTQTNERPQWTCVRNSD